MRVRPLCALTPLLSAFLAVTGVSAHASAPVESTQWLLNQIEKAEKNYRFDIAKDALKKLLYKDPKSRAIRLELIRLEVLSPDSPESAKRLTDELCASGRDKYCSRASGFINTAKGPASELMNTAQMFISGGNYEAAVEALRDARRKYEVGVDAMLLQLETELLIPRYRNEALTELKSLLRTEQDNPFFIERVKSVLLRDKVNQLSAFGISNAYHAANRNRAVEALEQCLRLAPEDARRERWLNTLKGATFWLHMDKADAAYDYGRLNEAEEAYRRAQLYADETPYAYLGLANVAQKRGQYGKARAYINKALSEAKMVTAEERARILHKLQSINVTALENRAEKLYREQKHPELVKTLTRLLKVDPDSPWTAYRLAETYLKLNETQKADAVFTRLSKSQLSSSRWAHPYALILYSQDRYEDALKVLEQVRRPTPETLRLSKELREEIIEHKAIELAKGGHYAEALNEIDKISTPAPYVRTLKAELLYESGDYAGALSAYQALDRTSEERGASILGSARSLIKLNRKKEASALLDALTAEQLQTFSAYQIEDIASLYREEGRADKVSKLYRLFLDSPAEKTQEEQVFILNHYGFQLKEEGKNEEALNIFKRGFAAQGLIPSADADNEVFTQAMLTKNEEREWPESSLVANASELYEQGNTTITSQITFRRDPGEKGYSDEKRFVGIIEAETPFKGGRLTLRSDSVYLNEGSFGGGVGRLFGYCASFDCSGSGYASPIDKDFGNSFAIAWRNQRWSGDIGTTPIGFKYNTVVGSLSHRWEFDSSALMFGVFRRPQDSSLLSFGGQRDPVTGKTWGGVIRNGLELSGSLGFNDRHGLWWFGKYEFLKGHNVQNNHAFEGMVGTYHQLISKPNHRLVLGPSLLFMSYKNNEHQYTFGNGGYYSPQRYVSAGVSLRDTGRTENFSWDLQGSVGLSYAKKDDIKRYPLGMRGSTILPTGRPASASSISDLLAIDKGESSVGVGFKLAGAFEQRLSSHFVLGGAAEYQKSDGYSPFTASLWLKFYFKPWKGDMRLYPEPLKPYSNW